MATPYEKEFMVVVADAAQQYAIDYPGRCIVSRVAVAKIDGSGSAAFTVYNRKFVSDTFNIINIVDDGNGKVQMTVPGNTPVRAGDKVTVAGTTSYDGGHRLTSVINDTVNNVRILVSSTNFSVEKLNIGTVKLDIPSGEQALYELDSQTGTDYAETFPEVPFVNQDVLPNLNRGVNRKMYIKFGATGTFKVIVRSREGIAIGS